MAQFDRPRRAALLGFAALLPAWLAGCGLVDQRTFDPQAGLPPVRPKPPTPPLPLAPALAGPPPLLSVRLPAPSGLRADIARVVAAARARKPNVAFEVVEITPDPQPGNSAATVGQMIVDAGVPAARVTLAVRPLAGVANEIRVFVR